MVCLYRFLGERGMLVRGMRGMRDMRDMRGSSDACSASGHLVACQGIVGKSGFACDSPMQGNGPKLGGALLW